MSWLARYDERTGILLALTAEEAAVWEGFVPGQPEEGATWEEIWDAAYRAGCVEVPSAGEPLRVCYVVNEDGTWDRWRGVGHFPDGPAVG